MSDAPSTGTAGPAAAPAAGDVTSSPAPSTGQTIQPPSRRERMIAAVRQSRSGLVSPRSDPQPGAPAPGPQTAAARESDPSAPETGDVERDAAAEGDRPASDDQKKQERVISQREFRERLERAQGQRDKLQERLSSIELERDQYESALQLALMELHELRGITAQGLKLDDRDLALRQHALSDAARRAHGEVQTRAEQRAQEAKAAALKAEQGERIRSQVAAALEEFGSAVSAIEIVSEMQRRKGVSPREIARQLYERRRAAFASPSTTPSIAPLQRAAPQAPTTARASSSGPAPAHRHPNTVPGMRARLAELRAQGAIR